MASIEKVTASGVANWLRHNNRTIEKDGNTDIDKSRSPENYSLTPYIHIPREEQYDRREEIRKLEFQHYKELKDQFFCFNRKDVNTLVSVVVTCPKEITDPETEEKFFKGVSDFLCNRYGNTVSVTVHKDEGKHYVLKDNAGNPVLDKSGNPVKEWHEGRSHLHYTFIPTVKINHAALEKKKNPVKAMFNYQEKISAKERIDRKELLRLHPDMNRYLNEHCGIKCNLNSGITKAQGGNKTVSELKKEFDKNVIRDLTIENAQLRKDYEAARIELSKKVDITQSTEITVRDQKISAANLRITELEKLLSASEINKSETADILKNKQEYIKSLEKEVSKVNAYKEIINTQNTELSSLHEEVNSLKNELRAVEREKEAVIHEKDREIEALKQEKNIRQDISKEWGSSSNWGENRGWGHIERGTQTWNMDQNS